MRHLQPDNYSCIDCPVSGSASIETFRNLFRLLDSKRDGILTPSGKPKKKPWYAITHCPSCHAISMTGIRAELGSRFRCKNTLWKRNIGIYPCDAEVEVIESHGDDIEKVLDKQEEWRDKYVRAQKKERT